MSDEKNFVPFGKCPSEAPWKSRRNGRLVVCRDGAIRYHDKAMMPYASPTERRETMIAVRYARNTWAMWLNETGGSIGTAP